MFRFLHWRSVFRRRKFESEMADELAFHLQSRTEDLIRSGLSPQEAEHRARLQFGGRERYRVECRESHRVHWLDEIGRNVRYALRNLRKSPAFSLAAIVSLALGIGINTFVFSVFDSLILRPLPVTDPARVSFLETGTGNGYSFPDYKDLRNRNTTFSGMAGYRISVMNFEAGGEPSRMWCYLATGNYFDLLGLKPAAGHFFHQSDDLRPGASPYAVLSYAAWQSRFAGNPAVAGRTVRINGLSYTVIGVAPKGFHGTEMFYWPEVWIPMMMQAQVEVGNPWLEERSTWDTMILGRLKPNVTRAQAAADLNRIAGELAQEYPLNDKGLRIRLAEPGFMGSSLRGSVEAFTGGVLLLASLVLLTACSNLAGLMLARITDRQRELAIRFSIGAGRLRIVCQLLTESFVLAFLGGVSGCGLALVACKLFSSWRAPIDFPLQFAVTPDWRLLAFVSAATLATGLLFGLGPALRSSRTDLNPLLKGSSGVAVFKTVQRVALRDLFLGGQVSFCFVLVFCCILSLHGLQRAITLPIGFDPQNVTVAGIDLGSAGYSEAQGRVFQKHIAENLRRLPGVTSVAYANSLPLGIDQSTTSVERTDEIEREGRRSQHANWYDVSPGLLSTLQVPLLRGRDFNEHDNEHAPLVAIVNQTFAQEILKTMNPIGKTFRYGPNSPLVQVIGLVKDGKYVSLTEASDPVVFRPILQDYNSTTTLVVRSRNSAAALVPRMRKEIAALDPKLPIYGAGSLESMLGFAMFPMHAAAIALTAFGVLALLLTVTGIYGLVDYAVARRTRELGIRIAVGARGIELLRLLLGKLMFVVLAGLGLGVVLAFAAGPALSAIIYTTSPRDPVLLLEVFIALLGAALLSSYRPVLRGLSVNPVDALRSE
jgi:predicted permease